MVNKNKEEKTLYNQLSILIDQDGFSFYIKHENDSKSVYIPKTFVRDINSSKSLKLFKSQLNNCFLNYSFSSLKLSFSNPYFSLVPSKYFEESAMTDYLKYNVELFETDHVVSDEISCINAHQVFIPLMNYHNLVLEFIEEFEFEHFTNSLISGSYALQTDGQLLKVFVHDKQLEIVAFENGIFKLCNYFEYSNEVDLVYYILFCIEELDFDQNEMKLEVYHSTQETAWKELLELYIAHVEYSHSNLVEFIS